MLYLIGLGMNEKSLSLEAIEACKKCSKIYLESYTVDFPYDVKALEANLKLKVEIIKRDGVESQKLIKEAKEKDIALLIFGSPLFATTHITLMIDAKAYGVETKIIYNASVFDAIAETGLQLYKFGKIGSMAKFLPEKGYMPTSFIEVIKENISIKAHTLLLIDIGFKAEEALDQFEKVIKDNKLKLKEIIICSRAGSNNSKIFYGKIDDLKNKEIDLPFCIIIPSELHFLEKEYLENFKI